MRVLALKNLNIEACPPPLRKRLENRQSGDETGERH